MRSAIRKHMRDFVAIVALVLVAAFIGLYVLAHQRTTLPGWVPIFGQDVYTLKGEFSTAQAITPGQGQTVDIAGVQVGEITNVDLVNGRAIVTMQLKPKYKGRVYRNATMLLRPKTGLKDMIVELNPGTPAAGKPVGDGYTVPVSNTLPDVNLDEILGVLDADTRTYLQLLLNGADTGLKGNGRNLAQVLRRFEPTARYGAEITRELQHRRRALARSIHNFGIFVNALAAQRRAARHVRRQLQRRLPALRQPGREPAEHAPAAARRAAPDERRAREDARLHRPGRPGASGAAAGRARARPLARRDAAVPARDDADHPEPDPSVHAASQRRS